MSRQWSTAPAVVIDPLTGLRNGLALRDEVERQLDLVRRRGPEGCVAVLDVDGLRAINDEHGFEAGDQVLRDIARALARHMRLSDVAARLGGDRFAVLLPHTPLADAVGAMTRVRETIASTVVAAGTAPVTATIGLAGLDPRLPGATEVLARADRACREGKESAAVVVVHEPTEVAQVEVPSSPGA